MPTEATIENIFNEVQNLNAKLDALPGIIEIAGNQVKVITLDELSESMGLLKAGEFRVGNGRVPGDSFSGVRIGYPPMNYPRTSTASSDLYNIVGVEADTLQIGIRASDGVLVAGGGLVYLDRDGVNIIQGTVDENAITWWDTGSTNITADIFSFWAAGISALHMRSHALRTDTADSDQAYSARLELGAYNEIGDSDHAIFMRFNRTDQAVEWRLEDQDTDIQDTDSVDLLRHPISYIRDSDGLALMTVNDVNDLDFGDMDFLMEYPTSTTAVVDLFRASASDSDFYFGVPLSLAPRAAADIADPDTEVIKLWADTAGEMRLTDSAGEDWYLTKSTSTGGAGGDVTLIASTILTSVSTGIVFSSIPGTYDHLLIRASARSDRSGNEVDAVLLIFNNDTGANYALVTIDLSHSNTIGTGADTAGASMDLCLIPAATAPTGEFNNLEATIQHYADTTGRTSVRTANMYARNTASSGLVAQQNVCTWRDVSVITSINVDCQISNFVAGSHFLLYGVN